MRILRFVAAATLLVYTLASLAGLGAIAAARAGVLTPPADTPAAVVDLMAGASLAQLGVWTAALALYLVVIAKLVRRVKAFTFWGAAFLLDVVNWLWFRSAGYYEAAIPQNLVYADYVVFGANLAVGAAILLLGRTHLD
jgi:hypothetical protein